jgi:hypothetical protein
MVTFWLALSRRVSVGRLIRSVRAISAWVKSASRRIHRIDSASRRARSTTAKVVENQVHM